MTQLTPEDKQAIINELLSSLSTNCCKIEQLTQVNSLVESNFFELAGGKKVSFATLKDELHKIVSNIIINLKTESLENITGMIGKADGIAPLGSDTKVPYTNLPYICVKFDKFVTLSGNKAISSDESLVPPSGSVVAYNSVVRCFVLLTPDGNNYYRAWKGMRAWGFFNGNGATPHRGLIYWDGKHIYTFDNVLGMQNILDIGGQTIPSDGLVLMSKAEAVLLVEKEFESPLIID